MSFEVFRDDPSPRRIGIVNPGKGEFGAELAFQLIGRHVGWQPGEIRQDMTFRFRYYEVEYVVHVTSDDTSASPEVRQEILSVTEKEI